MKKLSSLILLFTVMQSATAQWHQRELTITQTHYFDPSFFIPRSVHFSDRNNGFIVAGNPVFHFNGRQWLPVRHPEISTTFKAVFTLNSRNTFLAGDYGVLYKYDGNFFKKINTPTRNNLSGIYMIDSANGWVSGEGGTILHIMGDSVIDYSIYPPFDIRHIYFDKPDHGWAFTLRSYWNVYEFKNNKWTEHSSINGIITGIDFTPTGEGYVSSTENLFHYNKSHNRWEPVFPQNLTNPIESVSMLNDSTGICMQVNNSYLLYKKGKWTTYHADLTNMSDVQYVDSATIWAIASHNDNVDYWHLKNHLIYQLKDTGWQQTSLSYLDTIRTELWKGTAANVSAFDKKHVRLNGFLINIPETSDWIDTIKTLDPPLDSFLSVKSYSTTLAWGQDGTSLISAQGNRFTTHPLFNFSPFDTLNLIYGTHYFDDTTCWAVGVKTAWGVVENEIPYLVYYDKAKNSITREYDPPTTKIPWHVHFANKNYGWCVGDSGLIVKYENNNWQMMNYPTDEFLAAVFTIDATNAWAAGGNGTLLKYDGKSWTKVNINTTKVISSLYFTDKDHGWLVGEGGLMYKYDGTSWSQDKSITTNDLYDIYMVNSKYGWAVGDSGTLLQYINNDTTAIGRIANADIPSTIFPNPSSENTTIIFELKKAGNTVINLFNQQGNKVATYDLGMLQVGKFSKSINISNLQDGTYFYKIISSGERGQGKFIKVH